MTAIIFGVNGQDGYYLTKLLIGNGIRVIGVSRSAGDVIGDVSNYHLVQSLIEKYKPKYIFHFAANSTTDHSALFDNQQAIVQGTINILENVRLHCPTAKVFLSGSALQFENQGHPIDENTSFHGNNHYSIARIHSTYTGRYYRINFGLKIYIGYFFNHDSPLRTEKHVNQKIASAARRIAAGSLEKLSLNNIEVQKEFNYSADIVEAVWILINQNIKYEAVLGCGQAYSIKDWLEACFMRINKPWQEHTLIRKNLFPEYKVLVSNPKLIKDLNWRPKISFIEMADIMMR